MEIKQNVSNLSWCILHITLFNFPCNLSRNLGKRSITSCRRHFTCCNLGLQLAMVSKDLFNRCNKQNRILRCAIVSSQKKLQDELQIIRFTSCSLPETCLLGHCDTSRKEDCIVSQVRHYLLSTMLVLDYPGYLKKVVTRLGAHHN